MKALDIDRRVSSSEPAVRGFIYVSKNSSFISLQTVGFSPHFVSINNPNLFFQGDGLLNEEILRKNSPSALQQVFANRHDTIRIVYAVSTSHTSLLSLATDLSEYGVLHRGHVTTPSEQIHIAVFERYPKDSFHSITRNPQIRASAVQQQSYFGLIISLFIKNSTRMYKVAVHFSNDVISINETEVIRVVSPNMLDLSTKRNSSFAKYSVGSTIEFTSKIGQNKAASGCPDDVYFIELTAPSADGNSTVQLVPLIVCRYSIPSSAISLKNETFNDPAFALSEAALSKWRTRLSNIAFNQLLVSIRRDSWLSDFQSFCAGVRNNLLLQKSDEKQKVSDSTFVCAFLPQQQSQLSWLLNSLYLFMKQDILPSHPLVQSVEWLLTSFWPSIRPVMTDVISNRSQSPRWIEEFSKLLSAWLTRSGLTVEEIYQSLGASSVFDSEQLNYKYLQICDSNTSMAGTFIPLAGLSNIINEFRIIQSTNSLSAERGTPFFSEEILREFDSLDFCLTQMHGQGALLATLTELDDFNTRAAHFLQSWIGYRAEPALVALRDKLRMNKLASAGSVNSEKNFDSERSTSLVGVFSTNRRWSCTSILPGMNLYVHEVQNAGKSFIPAKEVSTVLVWTYDHENFVDLNNYLNFVSIVEKLQLRISSLEKFVPIIKLESSIRFNSSESNTYALICEWSERWCFLSDFSTRHGGLLLNGKFDLFRVLATNLIDAVQTVNSSGIRLRSLNPFTVIIDENFACVKLLLTPVDVDTSGSVLQTYINHCKNEKWLRPFIPTKTVNDIEGSDLPRDDWVHWSLGICLYYLAFGESIDEGNCDSIGSILLHLMSKYCLPKSTGEKEQANLGNVLSTHQDAVKLTGGVAVSLMELFMNSNDSDKALFQIISRFMSFSLDKLSRCRSAFTHEQFSGGRSETVLLSRWEDLFLTIYSKVGCNKSTIEQIRRMFATLPSPLSEEAAYLFIQKSFDLDISRNEFSSFIVALSSVTSSDIDKTNKADNVLPKALKALSVLLEEIQQYYNFQQLLYLFAQCITVEQGVLFDGRKVNDFANLPIFSGVDERSLLKAQQELKLLNRNYCNSTEFVTVYFLRPLQSAYMGIMGENSVESSSSLMNIMAFINSFEGLLPKISSASSERPNLGKSHSDFWQDLDYKKTIAEALDFQCLQIIAFLTLKIYAINATPHEDGRKLRFQCTERVRTFFGNLIAFLSSEGRHLSVEKLVRNAGNDVAKRQLVDSILHSTLDAVLMLALGEEAPVLARSSGSAEKEAFRIYPKLFDSSNLLKQDGEVILLGSRWDEGVYRLYDPLLVQIVGESGAGSSHFPLGLEMIKSIDAVTNFHVASSGIVHSKNSLQSLSFSIKGSSYFLSLIQLARKFSNTESKLSSLQYRSTHTADIPKLNDFSAQAVISTATLLLPLVSASSAKTVVSRDQGKKPGNRGDTPSSAPGSGSSSRSGSRSLAGVYSLVSSEAFYLQRCQAMVDCKCAQRLQSFFGTSDDVIKLSLLKLLAGVLAYCQYLPAKVSLSPRLPFDQLGRDFTSPGWTSGVAEVLRSKASNVDMLGYAVLCCKLMAHRRDWMRSWAPFQVLPSLCSLSVRPTKQYSPIRADCKESLRMASIHNPSNLKALLTLRLLPSESLESFPRPAPLSDLLVEARDISFGSTIAEQTKFADILVVWLSECLSTANIQSPSQSSVSLKDGDLELLMELSELLVQWLTRLSSMVVMRLFQPVPADSRTLPAGASTSQTRADVLSSKEKLRMSSEVVFKYIQSLRLLCDYFMAVRHPKLVQLVICCLCGPPSARLTGQTDRIEADSGDGGYLRVLENVTATYDVETFIPLQMMLQLLHCIAVFISQSGKEILGTICSCDIVRVIFKCFVYCEKMSGEVLRMQRETAFWRTAARDMRTALRDVWTALLSSEDPRVYEDIVDCGILQRLFENWLLSDVYVVLSGETASRHAEEGVCNAHLFRHAAIEMLFSLSALSVSSETLIAEAVRLAIATDMVMK